MRVAFPVPMALLALASALALRAAPADVSFSQSAQSVETYDFVEVTLNIVCRTRAIRSLAPR